MMSRKQSKGRTMINLDEIRCAATQRILDSMPAAIDQIKAEREREAWNLRKVVRDKERSEEAAILVMPGHSGLPANRQQTE